MGVQIKMHFVHLVIFFGQHNRSNVFAIGRIVRKFQQTGSVGNVKIPVNARPVRPAKNISVVRDSVAQQLSTSRTSLMRILNKDLNLHAFKVQLTQELRPTDHFERRQYAEWLVEHTE